MLALNHTNPMPKAETDQLRFRTSAGKGSFKYITRDPVDWTKGVRLFNRLRISGKSVTILGFYVGFVEENHLLGGVYAKISTDDRGIYFFTKGR